MIPRRRLMLMLAVFGAMLFGCYAMRPAVPPVVQIGGK